MNHFIPHFTLQNYDFESTEEKNRKESWRETNLFDFFVATRQSFPTHKNIIRRPLHAFVRDHVALNAYRRTIHNLPILTLLEGNITDMRENSKLIDDTPLPTECRACTEEKESHQQFFFECLKF